MKLHSSSLSALQSILVGSTAIGALFVPTAGASAQEVVVNSGQSRALTKQAKPIDGILVKGGTLTASEIEIKRTAAKAAAATIEDGGRIELARSKVSSADAALAATVNGTSQATFVIGDKSQIEATKGPLLNVTRGAQGGTGTVDLVINGDAKVSGDIVDSGRKPGGFTDVRVESARFDGGFTGVRTLTLANGGVWGVGAKTGIDAVALSNGSGVLDVAKDATLAAPLSGTSKLVKRGTGALTLSGNSSFTGATSVESGPLVVHGRLPSAVTVGNGATLGGAGSIAALTVASGGAVAPGNSATHSIGTLTVDGNVTLDSGSTYRAEIGGQGKSDLIAAGGSATLGGATLAVAPAAETGYIQPMNYTILTAKGGVNGRFGTIAGTETLPFLTPSLTYAPQAVTLNLARNNVMFASVATSPDQAAVAKAIEAGGAASALYGTVMRLSRETAPRSFEALAGTEHASTSGVLIDQSQRIGQLVLGRLRQTDFTEAAQASGGVTAWAQPFGSWAHPRAGNSGFSQRNLGLITGLDAEVGGSWRLGGAFSHSWTDLNFDNGSKGEVNSDTLAAYGGGLLGPLHARLGGAYSWHRVSMERHLRIPGMSSDPFARYKANTLQAFGEVSTPFDLGTATVEPFAGLNYVRLKSNAIAETGGGAGALRGASDTRDVTYSNLGLRASFDLGRITPYASAAWQHAFGDWAAARQLTFVDTGTSFLGKGVPVARDSAALEAGIQATFLERGTLNLSYVGNLSKQTKENGVKLGFSYAF